MAAAGTAPRTCSSSSRIRSAETAIAGDGRDREPARGRPAARASASGRTSAPRAPATQPSPTARPSRTSNAANDAIGAVALDEYAAQRGPADEGTAEDDTVGAGGQGLCRLVRSADAAGYLAADAHPIDDGSYHRRLQGLALASCVQVDDMDPRGTLVCPPTGDGHRVVTVVGDRVEVTTRECVHPPAQQVDGRYKFHATMLPCYLKIQRSADHPAGRP